MTTELFEKGLAELKAGNYGEARKLFTQNEEKLGTASKTKEMVREADAALFQGKLDVAAETLDQVLDRNPSIPEAYLGLARIALFTGQKGEAKTHATAATKIAPQLGLSWTMLGLVHESDGDVKQALSLLEKGAQLSPNVFLCQFNYGRILASENRAAEGIPFLIKATDLEPKNPDGFMVLGLAQRQLKQHEKAIKTVEKAKDLSPKNPDGWATLADLLFEVKQFKAAKDVLDLGLKSVGDHPALLEKALACAMMLDDQKAGVDYVERELKVVPNHEQGWINLANLTLMTGDWDKSEWAARELLKKNPKAWEAWYHLGNLFDAVPDEPKAEEAYRNALAIKPDEWRVVMNLGTLLLQSTAKAKHLEARGLLQKAKGLVPAGEWRAHYNLALAHVRLGEVKEALALVKEIQAKAPAKDPMVEEAKKLESNLLEKN
ncbi:MAG TPA: tetratricopeptide repeat protein [Archangium sp.]